MTEAARYARMQIKEEMEMIEMKKGKRKRTDLGDFGDTEDAASFGRITKGIFKKKHKKRQK